MAERPTDETRKFLMSVARRTAETNDNHFFISAGTGEIISSGYLKGNGDYFPHTPSNAYCIGIHKNLKFTYKQLDEIIDSAISLYNEEQQNQEMFNEATELLKKRISYKGRGKTERPVCPLCGEDMKVSLEHVRGKSPKKYGHHCLKCKYQTFD